MAGKPKREKRSKLQIANEPIPAEEKIARLLGLLLVKEMEQRTDQVTLLRAVGFQISEVASMLGITENNVKVASHHGRKRQHTRKPGNHSKKK